MLGSFLFWRKLSQNIFKITKKIVPVNYCKYWLCSRGVALSLSFSALIEWQSRPLCWKSFPREKLRGSHLCCVECSLFEFSPLSKLLPLPLGWYGEDELVITFSWEVSLCLWDLAKPRKGHLGCPVYSSSSLNLREKHSFTWVKIPCLLLAGKYGLGTKSGKRPLSLIPV